MGGLAPVLLGVRFVSFTGPDESYGEEDRHKAPTLPRILPLSLHDRSEGYEVWTDSISKFIRFVLSYLLNNTCKAAPRVLFFWYT